MTKTLFEGWAAENFKDRATHAEVTGHAAHILSVAADKHPHLHAHAAQLHRQASWAHHDVAESSTHDETAAAHKVHAASHQAHADTHEHAHLGVYKGDLNYTTDNHKTALKNCISSSKKFCETASGAKGMKESTELTEETLPPVSGLVSKIIGGNHAEAIVDFDALMDNRLETKLNARTKELAAQLFGPSIVKTEEVEEEVEEAPVEEAPVETEESDDDEIAAHLQTLATEMWDGIVAEDENADMDIFVESFNSALAAQGLDEKYALWRPTESGFTKKGIERARKKQSPSVPATGKKESPAEKRFKAKLQAAKMTTHAHNEPPRVEAVEAEGAEELTELKARTLRHYVGHAKKQVATAKQEIKKADATGNKAVSSYFQARVAKRTAGIKKVQGQQKSAKAKRVAAAKKKEKAAAAAPAAKTES